MSLLRCPIAIHFSLPFVRCQSDASASLLSLKSQGGNVGHATSATVRRVSEYTYSYDMHAIAGWLSVTNTSACGGGKDTFHDFLTSEFVHKELDDFNK